MSAAWLPDRTAKLEDIRKAAVKAALKRLKDAAQDRVVLLSPIAGVGRKLHLSAATIVVDDAVLHSAVPRISGAAASRSTVRSRQPFSTTRLPTAARRKWRRHGGS